MWVIIANVKGQVILYLLFICPHLNLGVRLLVGVPPCNV